jgi:hypothetical protein
MLNDRKIKDRIVMESRPIQVFPSFIHISLNFRHLLWAALCPVDVIPHVAKATSAGPLNLWPG